MRRLVWAGWLPVVFYGALGGLRYSTFHNETFDLAFYARMAHGLARLDFYDPVVGGHVLGLHISPILMPLGLLGCLLGQVPVLLLAQTLSAGLAAQILARLGERRLGPWGAAAGLVFALHPNLGHVLSYEFHPGNLALFPLAYMLDALDRRDARGFGLATLGVLLCREDLAAITLMTGLVAWWMARQREREQPADTAAAAPDPMRSAALGVTSLSALWLGLWVGLIIPRFAPVSGSLDAHFGHLGGSLVSAGLSLFTRPAAVLAHLSRPEKLSYLPRLLAPMLFLPLLSPRRLLPALPVLAMLLLSQFSTTSQLRSHYLTPALPALVWAGVHGLAGLDARRHRRVLRFLAAAVLLGFVGAGATPLSPYFSFSYFWPDARSATASELLRQVPETASIQAPHVLLPHLAERQTLHQVSPPERAVDLWVLDVSHRTEYAGSGTLLRTAEEPHVRDFMARADRGVVFYEPPFLLLRRGADPRVALSPFFDATPAQTAPPPQPLCACLSVTHASPRATGIRLHFVATAACPPDLALRVGESERPTRVDLLFLGAASPAHLRPGDRVFSDHPELRGPVHVGALRSSGAAPEPSDPRSVLVPLVEE